MDELKRFLKYKGNLPSLIIVGILLVGLGAGLVLVRQQQTLKSQAYPICGLATDLRVQGLNFPTRVAARSQVNIQVRGWRSMRAYIHGNTNLDASDQSNQSYDPNSITPTTDQFFLLNRTITSCGGDCNINNCSNFGNECACGGSISFTAPTQPGVYTIAVNAAADDVNNSEVCAWNGAYYQWGSNNGERCYNVGFRFLEVFGPEGTPPQASVSGPSSGNVGQSIPYSATATGTRLLGMGIFAAPTNANLSLQSSWTTIVNDLSRCNFQSSCSISGNWTPSSPGSYYVVVNAYSDSNGDGQRDGGNENCSGSPSLPPGWANCGGSSRITLTVNAASPPTPTPTPTPPSGCPTGQTRPHRICSGTTCQEVNTCGASSCTSNAQCTGSPTPTPTPTPSTGPGTRTRAYKIADSERALDSAPEQPYTQHGLIIDHELPDASPGVKQIWVRFISTTGQTADQLPINVQVLDKNPAITSCKLEISGSTVDFTIKGVNFGSTIGKGVKAGNSDIRVSRWTPTEVRGSLTNVPAGENIPIILRRSDDQTAEGVCSSITQIFFSGRLFCPQVNKNNTFKGELTVREVTASAQLKKSPFTLSGGILKDLPINLQEGVVYKLGIKVEKGLRKLFNLIVTKGTMNISNLILPLGDIYPIGAGDSKINSFDKAELIRQWGPVTANKNCDLNGDEVCNSFEWACMREFFNQEDEPEP